MSNSLTITRCKHRGLYTWEDLERRVCIWHLLPFWPWLLPRFQSKKPSCQPPLQDCAVIKAMSAWSKLASSSEAPNTVKHIQEAWDAIITTSAYYNLLETSSLHIDQAQIKTLLTPFTGNWLCTAFNSSCLKTVRRGNSCRNRIPLRNSHMPASHLWIIAGRQRAARPGMSHELTTPYLPLPT